jgi:membrane-bound lytic murein transglycosylase B
MNTGRSNGKITIMEDTLRRMMGSNKGGRGVDQFAEEAGAEFFVQDQRAKGQIFIVDKNERVVWCWNRHRVDVMIEVTRHEKRTVE